MSSVACGPKGGARRLARWAEEKTLSHLSHVGTLPRFVSPSLAPHTGYSIFFFSFVSVSLTFSAPIPSPSDIFRSSFPAMIVHCIRPVLKREPAPFVASWAASFGFDTVWGLALHNRRLQLAALVVAKIPLEIIHGIMVGVVIRIGVTIILGFARSRHVEAGNLH